MGKQKIAKFFADLRLSYCKLPAENLIYGKFPADINLFKVNNGKVRMLCEICVY